MLLIINLRSISLPFITNVDMDIYKIFSEDIEFTPKEFAKIKGTERIQVNNILAAISVTVITILITVGRQEKESLAFSLVLAQLAAAIPLLITSSLFYSKMCYRAGGEYRTWNTFALVLHTFGYNFILNSLAIIIYAASYKFAAFLLIGLSFTLVVLYSVLDAALDKKRISERIYKFVLYLLVLLVSFAPLYFL